ncbi:MAG: [FeFe] hydrogenase H-cluster radical SAM maturase HydE [Clostridiales bacterium]|nr:[FeFe] hydrogenase H-cluster radical SAM maturase HydE [Candidatus Crickella merdequi]
MTDLYKLVDKLEEEKELSLEEWTRLIEGQSSEISEYVFSKARKAREPFYGHEVYVRGLIEISNICRNDCIYCGIRCSNVKVNRYRLTKEEILSCCRSGWEMGFRTFVMQGGEDPYYTDEVLCDIIAAIREEFPECAITLSVGERSKESYRKLKEAGAERYLLRHETANEEHYRMLHPENLSLAVRKECLFNLRELGYQVGAGFMVGAPYQTARHLAEDMIFLKELNPAMVGIGPFIPHHDTPFADMKAGTLEQTIYLLGLIRLMLPKVLLPATTALGTSDPLGREKGMEAGANVVMPNLSPTEVRKDYLLYDNKICVNEEAAENLRSLKARMEAIGYMVVCDRGDSKNMEN